MKPSNRFTHLIDGDSLILLDIIDISDMQKTVAEEVESIEMILNSVTNNDVSFSFSSKVVTSSTERDFHVHEASLPLIYFKMRDQRTNESCSTTRAAK